MMDEATYTKESTELLPTLYRVCMSILRSHADAQDAAQQALMKAWTARERVEPARYRAWLTRVAINECRDIQRHRMRVVPVEKMEDDKGYTPPDNSLAEAIETLDEKLRTPLMLKYMEHYTEKEIVQALGLTAPVVKNRLFRARRALEKLLSEEVTFE